MAGKVVRLCLLLSLGIALLASTSEGGKRFKGKDGKDAKIESDASSSVELDAEQPRFTPPEKFVPTISKSDASSSVELDAEQPRFTPPEKFVPTISKSAGGTHGARWLTNAGGEKIIWKPDAHNPDKQGHGGHTWPSTEAEICGTNLARHLSFGRGPHVALTAAEFDVREIGQIGLGVEPLPIDGNMNVWKGMGRNGINVKDFSLNQIADVISQLIADHVIGNYDSLSANIGVLDDSLGDIPKETIIGFDKGTAFRYVAYGDGFLTLNLPGYLILQLDGDAAISASEFEDPDITLGGVNPWFRFDPPQSERSKVGPNSKMPVYGPVVEALCNGDLAFTVKEVRDHPLVKKSVRQARTLDKMTVVKFTKLYAEATYGQKEELKEKFYQQIMNRAHNLKATRNENILQFVAEQKGEDGRKRIVNTMEGLDYIFASEDSLMAFEKLGPVGEVQLRGSVLDTVNKKLPQEPSPRVVDTLAADSSDTDSSEGLEM